MQKLIAEKTLSNLEIFPTPDLPIGQKALQAGFKKITMADIRKRFRCDEITAQEKEKARLEAMEWIDENNETKTFWGKKIKKEPYYFEYEDSYWYAYLRHNKLEKKFHHLFCSVMEENLDKYIEEQIPLHCLTQVDKAKKIGINEFSVMYPVLHDRRLVDPIIVGFIGEKRRQFHHSDGEIISHMVEIASWQ